jgi:hypothetical protein
LRNIEIGESVERLINASFDPDPEDLLRVTGREGINTLAREFPDLLCRETHDEIIRPDSQTLLYDTSYS